MRKYWFGLIVHHCNFDTIDQVYLFRFDILENSAYLSEVFLGYTDLAAISSLINISL
jgi:hypothetical protein